MFEGPRESEASFMVLISVDWGTAVGKPVEHSLQEGVGAGFHATSHSREREDGPFEFFEKGRGDIGGALTDGFEPFHDALNRLDTASKGGRKRARFAGGKINLVDRLTDRERQLRQILGGLFEEA
jgi:hypothetical protein